MVLVSDSNGGCMYAAVLFLIVLCCTACVSSPDINTPREILNHNGSLSTAFGITVQYDNEEQTMEVLDNLFRCEIRQGSDGMTVSLRVELQNINPPAGNHINSLYFRANDLPVDGTFHSLSGDPTSTAAEAAKLLVLESGRLVSVVPLQRTGSQNNFLVKIDSIEGSRRLRGLLFCSMTLPNTSRTAELIGEFTIEY